MGEPKYCCERLAVAFNQRQIVWSLDEGGSWNVATGAFGDFALTEMRHCPWCGERLPDGAIWEEGEDGRANR